MLDKYIPNICLLRYSYSLSNLIMFDILLLCSHFSCYNQWSMSLMKRNKEAEKEGKKEGSNKQTNERRKATDTMK